MLKCLWPCLTITKRSWKACSGMFSLYRIAIADLHFLCRIGLLFFVRVGSISLRSNFHIAYVFCFHWNRFFSTRFLEQRGVGTLWFWKWYEAYCIATDPLQKTNGNTSGMIFEYDITLKTKKQQQLLVKWFCKWKFSKV